MWGVIDKEMDLQCCSIYCYLPEEDPFDGEDGAIWSFNYFFFNKDRKRVCYLYLRGLSIISHNSAPRTPIKTKRGAEPDWGSDQRPSSKRARFWLGDRAANAISVWSDDDDDNNCADGGINVTIVHKDKKPQTVITNGENIVLSSGEATSPPVSDTASPESVRRSRSQDSVKGDNDDHDEPDLVSSD